MPGGHLIPSYKEAKLTLFDFILQMEKKKKFLYIKTIKCKLVAPSSQVETNTVDSKGVTFGCS